MLILRAIQPNDLETLLELASDAGSGMTTFKPNRDMLFDRIELASSSFAGKLIFEECDYIFVLEDSQTGLIAGVSAIKAAIGLTEPFYHFRLSTMVHASREAGVFSKMQTLSLTNDLTGCSELCSLFLHPTYRKGINSRLLSKGRMAFIAQFTQRFSQKLIAEMRGFQNELGCSPFYEGLGRHFFKRDYEQINCLIAQGQKSFVAELMPKFPIYITFLDQAAQSAIAKVHPETISARHMLEQEGLYFDSYVDIFDAGPILQSRLSELRTIRESHLTKTVLNSEDKSGETLLVSNTNLADFRAIIASSQAFEDALPLTKQQLNALHCSAGEAVCWFSLNPKKK